MERSHKESPIWGIVRRKDGRSVITDTVTGVVLRSSLLGYTSYKKAYNCGYNQCHTEPANYVVGSSAESKVVEDRYFNL